MKQRSPVLGYNHNLRHAGRLWHVQTEDSGVQSPHVFTHLFHGGTILATKRLDYDPTSEIDVVQKLMQSQHKAMMRELKAGAFDDKIAKFFGMPIEAAPGAVEEAAPVAPEPSEVAAPLQAETVPVIAIPAPSEPLAPTPSAPPPLGPPPPGPPPLGPPPPGPPPSLSTSPALTPTLLETPRQVPTASSTLNQASRTAPLIPRPAPRPTTPPPAAQGRPATKPVLQPARSMTTVVARRVTTSRSAQHGTQGRSSAVVARPARVVGSSKTGPSQTSNASRAPASAPAAAPSGDNIFGGPLPEKSLDDVILAYLSDDLTDKR